MLSCLPAIAVVAAADAHFHMSLCGFVLQGDGTESDYTTAPPFTALISLAFASEPPQFLEKNEALVTELRARFGSKSSRGELSPTLQLPTARFVTVPATPGSDVESLHVSRAWSRRADAISAGLTFGSLTKG